MSLFIGVLASEDSALQERVMFGILDGSINAGLSEYVLRSLSDRWVLKPKALSPIERALWGGRSVRSVRYELAKVTANTVSRVEQDGAGATLGLASQRRRKP
ncbi:hypothetical protein [Ensifer sp. 4252]|uniref:hypothetical protein n=1 Tax=Ensifer sp. 4252 TaxID=3373915 RepID=UPI003D208765